MKRLFFIPLLVLVLLSGCTPEPTPTSSLILEGWIDAGGHPVVLIHKSYVLENAGDSVQTLEDVVEDQLIPFGWVAVSDGKEEVVLTGKLDTMYLPPYTYSSIYMTGQSSRTYTVHVKYREMEATATTTIPPVATFDSLCIRSFTPPFVQITGYMSHVDMTEESYYAVFVREYGKAQYQVCPYGVFSSQDMHSGKMEVNIYTPYRERNDVTEAEMYFSANDSIEYQVKIARIDYPSYQFWKAYNEQIITRGILFVPVYKNLPGNISGGTGYFSGMGSSIYRFRAVPDTTYIF